MISEQPSDIAYLVDVIRRAFPDERIGTRRITITTGAQRTLGDFLATDPTSSPDAGVFVSYNGFNYPDPRERSSANESTTYAIYITAGLPAAAKHPTGSRTADDLESDAERIARAIVSAVNTDDGFRVPNSPRHRRGWCAGGQHLLLTTGIDAFEMTVIIQ
jgi:hypothetical protein